jgi:hypothetical protein
MYLVFNKGPFNCECDYECSCQDRDEIVPSIYNTKSNPIKKYVFSIPSNTSEISYTYYGYNILYP